MLHRSLFLALLLAACGDDTNIGPDPTDGNHGGSTSNSPNGAGGTGGTNDGGTSSVGGRGEGGRSEMQGLGYENGTRLRARTYVATDGAKQFIGWKDTELDVDCTFGPDATGASRCFPTPLVGFSVTTTFADAACTIPAAVVNPDCSGSTPKYVTKVEACGSWSTFEVGGELTTYYLQSGASCIVSPSPDNGYRALTPVPPATFVGAEEQVD